MKRSILILSFLLFAIVGCSDDDNKGGAATSISFAIPSVNLTDEVTTTVGISFSKPTTSAGTITIKVVETEAEHGVDYTTVPAVALTTLNIEFDSGVSQVTFDFNKLIPAFEGQVKNVEFTITDVSTGYEIVGNTTTILNFNESALVGNSLSPEVGGPSQANQVYIDLSSGAMTTVPRVSWDLGFYSGDEFRVILNNSVKMSTKSMGNSDMTAVVAQDDSMLIVQGAGNVEQVDNPSGIITGTAITEISENEEDNYVYLINLGSNPSENAPVLGSVAADTGSHRGWKKVRILRDGTGYKIQYADLNATSYNEVSIAKNVAYNFTFFSFDSESIVNVEPEKDKWDINFTTFTNVVNFDVPRPYFYPDFVTNNSRGGAMVYSVSTDDISYDNFSLSDVDNSKFIEDQRGIGSSWRGTSAMGPNGLPLSQFVLKDEVFYVLKDPAGNLYKIKMTEGALPNLERGHPTFQYALL